MGESKTSILYADFGEWSARDYLAEYYGEVMEDERHTLQFLIESLRTLPKVGRALDIGCGPCVHHCFPLVGHAEEIHCADFVPGNRLEIERWLKAEPDAFDWRPFAAETLRIEGLSTSARALQRREAETRQRITKVMAADVRASDPVGAAARGSYPLVTSHYCLEAISTDKAIFRSNVEHVTSLVAPGGSLIISVCSAADYYRVGDRRFPCSGVSGQDVLACLFALGLRDLDVRVRSTPSHTAQGYSSVVFGCGRKPHE